MGFHVEVGVKSGRNEWQSGLIGTIAWRSPWQHTIAGLSKLDFECYIYERSVLRARDIDVSMVGREVAGVRF